VGTFSGLWTGASSESTGDVQIESLDPKRSSQTRKVYDKFGQNLEYFSEHCHFILFVKEVQKRQLERLVAGVVYSTPLTLFVYDLGRKAKTRRLVTANRSRVSIRVKKIWPGPTA